MSIEAREKQYATIFGDWKFDKRMGTGSGGKTVVYQLKRSNLKWEEVSALKVVTIIEENGKIESLGEAYRKNYEEKRKEIRDEKATNGVSFIGSVPCRVERTDRP